MIYAEQLAHRLYRLSPNLDSTGPANAVLNAAWPLAVKDLGIQSAQWSFWYDEDFASDVVTAYSGLQGTVSAR